MKKAIFYLIDTFGDLKKTQAILAKHMCDIEAGKRFDHMSSGHEHFSSTVRCALEEVETRIRMLEK